MNFLPSCSPFSLVFPPTLLYFNFTFLSFTLCSLLSLSSFLPSCLPLPSFFSFPYLPPFLLKRLPFLFLPTSFFTSFLPSLSLSLISFSFSLSLTPHLSLSFLSLTSSLHPRYYMSFAPSFSLPALPLHNLSTHST